MRILFATTSAAGHFGPLIPFAHACLRAGHQVLVAGPASLAPLATRARLPLRAVAEPAAIGTASGRESTAAADPGEAIRRVVADKYAGARARAALPGMLAAIDDWRPDLIVRETVEFSSCVAAELRDVPQVRVGIGLTAAAEDLCLDFAADALDELRFDLELPRDAGAQRARRVACFLQAPRSLEPEQAAEPGWVRRFRVTASGPVTALPDWWDGRRAPLVYVSFGTEVPSRSRPYFPELYRTVVEALADLPVRALLTVGLQRDPAELGPLPASVHVENWIPQAAVMPHAAAMIGHGGAGSTKSALAGGVPMALVPLFADQPMNARRIADLGAGVALEHGPALASSVAAATRELLDDPRYAAAARGLADDYSRLPSADEAVDALPGIAADARLVVAR